MIATLGPAGTFSDKAVRKYIDRENLDQDIEFKNSIKSVFDFVNNGRGKGVIPIENMIDGSVGESLDLLYNNEVYVIDEIIVPIHLCLASNNKDFDTVLSHPKALGQARDYINSHDFKTRETVSTAKAMEIVSNSEDLGAIGTVMAAEKYGLDIIDREIEDKNNNVTRFFVLSKEEVNNNGKGKTSIAIHPNDDRPGLLHDLLGSFRKRGINLTKIESRPTKLNLGDYIFYIDFEGSQYDDNVKECLREIKEMAEIRIFGSYKSRY